VGERGGLKMDEHFELPPGDALDALAAHSLPALVGIGATFKRDKTRGCYVVRRVIERGPADREGGIVPGDVISKVDGILVASKSPEELTKLVLGPSGSSIDLGIMRNGESMSMTIRRATSKRPRVDPQDLNQSAHGTGVAAYVLVCPGSPRALHAAPGCQEPFYI